ncbi:MAG: fumarylacetoacetate hydrolase family protein [Desulfobacterales bacterium]|jgi:2-keto-4-pentenoate hydratase/2-oxohepta-3-ene-1,7-dioic acid hydratase in catechol pathway
MTMRLIRFGPKGMERPGIEIEDRIVDLRRYFPDIPDIGEAFFRNGWLEKVADLGATGEPMTERRGCPLARPSKIICLGKNYAEHAKEGGFDQPDKPLLFCKGSNALNGPYDPILLPRSCGEIDWEVELAVVIGREAKRIRKADARDVMAGVTIMNDVSGREAQFADSQWFRGKSFDTFAPLGPAIVTMEEIGDIRNLQLTAVVDGIVMQDGNSRDMIFDVATLIEFISEDMTLYPGDVISTGTPSGVGYFRNPPVLLTVGNVVECRIEKIGAIVNRLVDRLPE